MSIQENCLHPGEQGIAPIQMPPPSLDHSDLRVGEEMDGLFEQVFLWHKIGVQDAKKFAFGSSETHRQRSSLKASAISPMDTLHVKTTLAQFLCTGSGDLASLIRRIVQDLYLQKLLRIIQFAYRTDQSLGHVHFVENWQLHSHFRQFFELAQRHRRSIAVFQVQINDEI